MSSGSFSDGSIKLLPIFLDYVSVPLRINISDPGEYRKLKNPQPGKQKEIRRIKPPLDGFIADPVIYNGRSSNSSSTLVEDSR